MMKERYMFRAWHKSHKKMYDVNKITWGDSGEIIAAECVVKAKKNRIPAILYSAKLVEIELMYCTGKYAHGNGERALMYEGDIVSYVIFDYEGHDTHYTGTIEWLDGSFYIVGDNDRRALICEFDDTESDIEILGNVYEHPELLEETQ